MGFFFLLSVVIIHYTQSKDVELMSRRQDNIGFKITELKLIFIENVKMFNVVENRRSTIRVVFRAFKTC